MNTLRNAIPLLLGVAIVTVAPAQESRMQPSNTANQSMAMQSQERASMAGTSNAAAAESFVDQATQAGMTEVQLGQLALEKSSDPQIKQFAQRMVADHTKAGEQLTAIAKSENLKVPEKLDHKHAAMLKSMSGKSGADFDAAYAHDMQKDHDDAVALFEHATRLSDPKLAQFATETLPTLKEHKQLAQRLSTSRVATSQ